MRIPIRTYHYVPQGGDPAQPVKIYAMQEYSPGKHNARVDAYLIKIPDGLGPDVPDDPEMQTWAGVLKALTTWFNEETAEAVEARVTLISRDEVSHRGL